MNDDFDIGVAQVEEIDPELDRENWPVIFIDHEKDKPNYEFLAVHGTLKNNKPFDHELQVKRGVNVAVPPSIVNMLKNAIATSITQRENKSTGQTDTIRTDHSSIPWRLVEAGKYIR